MSPYFSEKTKNIRLNSSNFQLPWSGSSCALNTTSPVSSKTSSIRFSLTVLNFFPSADSSPLVHECVQPLYLKHSLSRHEGPSSFCPIVSRSLLTHDSSLLTPPAVFLAHFSNHRNLTFDPSLQNSI